MGEPDLLDQLRPGDHVCLIVDDEPLRTRSLAAFVRRGLRDQHRVIYEGHGGDHVRAELVAQGVDVESARRRDQLRITTAPAAYLPGDQFDAEATLAVWRAEAAGARAAGFRGLRAIGDMTWASRPMPGIDRLPWYEAQTNRLIAEGFVTGVCLYDRRLFPERQLRRLSRSHPATVTAGTDPRTVPMLRALRTTDPLGLRLEGEADLSNRQAVQAVVEHLAEDAGPGPVTVDLTGLRFADLGTVRMLLRLTAGGRRRLRLVGCSGPVRRLFDFQLPDGCRGIEHVARR